MNAFEVFFREFVKSFGGDLLQKGKTESADFLFREDNIVTELKTLENDARLEHAQKRQMPGLLWQILLVMPEGRNWKSGKSFLMLGRWTLLFQSARISSIR